MRILTVIDLNDDDLTKAYGADPRVTSIDDDDLLRSLDARAQEFYCGKHDDPVRGRVVAVGDITDVLPELLDAIEVGADGVSDTAPDYKRGHILGSLISMRQLADNYVPGF